MHKASGSIPRTTKKKYPNFLIRVEMVKDAQRLGCSCALQRALAQQVLRPWVCGQHRTGMGSSYQPWQGVSRSNSQMFRVLSMEPVASNRVLGAKAQVVTYLVNKHSVIYLCLANIFIMLEL